MRFKFTVYLSLWVVALIPGLALGQSVQEAVQKALSESPQLKSLEFKQKSLRLRALEADKLLNPELTLDLGRAANPEGPGRYQNFEIAQPISFSGRNSKMAKSLTAEADTQQVSAAIEKILLRGYLYQLIYEYKISIEYLKHTKERVARLQTIRTYLSSRVFSSPQKRVEADIVAARIILRTSELKQAEIRKKSAWERLNLYLQLPAEPTWNNEWLKADQIKVEEKADKTYSLDLRLLQAQISLNKTRAELEKSKITPDVTFTYKNQAYFQNAEQRTTSLGIKLPIPLWNQGLQIYRAAIMETEAAKSQYDFAKKQKETQIQIAKEDLRLQLELLKKLPMSKAVELEKDFVYTEVEFRKGRIDLITYFEFDDQHESSFIALTDTQKNTVDSLLRYALETSDEAVMDLIK